MFIFFFFNETPTTEIYTYCHPLSLHAALPIYPCRRGGARRARAAGRRRARHRRHAFRSARAGTAAGRNRGRRDGAAGDRRAAGPRARSEEHTSELQSLMRISYAVFCSTKKTILMTEDAKHDQQTTTLPHHN